MTRLAALALAGTVLALAGAARASSQPLQCQDEDVRVWKYNVPTTDSEARLITKQGWYSETSGVVLAVGSRLSKVWPVDPFPTYFYAVDAATGAEAWRLTGAAAHAPPFHLYDLVASHALDDVVHISTVQTRRVGLQAYAMADGSTQGAAYAGRACAPDEVLCRLLVIGAASVPGTTTQHRIVLLHQKTSTGRFSPTNWTDVELVGVTWELATGYKEAWTLLIDGQSAAPHPHDAQFSPDAVYVTLHHNLENMNGDVSTYNFATGKFVHAGPMFPVGGIFGVQPLIVFPPPAGAANKYDLYGLAQSGTTFDTAYYIARRNSTFGVSLVRYVPSSTDLTAVYANAGWSADGTRLLTFMGDNMCNSSTPGGLISGGDGTWCMGMPRSFGLGTDLYASAMHPSMARAWAMPLDQILTIEDNKVVAESDLLYAAATQSAFYVPKADAVVFATQTFNTLMAYKGTCVPGSGAPKPGPGLGSGWYALIAVGVGIVVALGLRWACRKPAASSYTAMPSRPGPAPQAAPPQHYQQYQQAPPSYGYPGPGGAGGGVPPPQVPQASQGYTGYAPPAGGGYDAPKV